MAWKCETWASRFHEWALFVFVSLALSACQASGVQIIAQPNQIRSFEGLRGRLPLVQQIPAPQIEPQRPLPVVAPVIPVLSPASPTVPVRVALPALVKSSLSPVQPFATPTPLIPILPSASPLNTFGAGGGGGGGGGGTQASPSPNSNNTPSALPTNTHIIDMSRDLDIKGVPITHPDPLPPEVLPTLDFQRGERLAYISRTNGFDTLYLSHLDGSQAKALTTHTHQRFPVFAADGRLIFFATDRLGQGWELFRLSPNGQAIRRLSFQQTDVKVWDSSSRQETLFTSQNKLYLYDHNTDAVRLVLEQIAVFAPTWSPDGERIAFAYNNQIASINRNAQDFQTHVQGVNVTSRLDWDGGQTVVFDQAGSILTASLTTGQTTTLSNQLDSEPQWSFDSQKIIFTSQRTGKHQIFMMNANGSQPNQITTVTAGAYSPTW